MERGDRTFRQAAIVFISGMILPGIAVALAGDLIVTAVSYHAFLGLLALGFGLVATAGIELLELDRLTFLFASFVWPWIVFLATLFVVLLLNSGEQIPEGPVADVVHTLWGNSRIWGASPSGSAVAYPAAFMLAGIAAIVLPHLYRRLSRELPVDAE